MEWKLTCPSSCLQDCPPLVCNMVILFLCWVGLEAVDDLSNGCYKLHSCSSSEILLKQPFLNIGLEVTRQFELHRQCWLLLSLGSHPHPGGCNSGFWI